MQIKLNEVRSPVLECLSTLSKVLNRQFRYSSVARYVSIKLGLLRTPSSIHAGASPCLVENPRSDPAVSLSPQGQSHKAIGNDVDISKTGNSSSCSPQPLRVLFLT